MLQRYDSSYNVLGTVKRSAKYSGMLYQVWEASHDESAYEVYDPDLEAGGDKGFGRLDTKEGVSKDEAQSYLQMLFPVAAEAVPVDEGYLLVLRDRASS